MDVIQSYTTEGLFKIAINGDLDASTVFKVDDVIRNAIKKQEYNILVDCKLLEYISSAGLGVFISHLDDVTAQKGKLVFFDMNETVYDVFKLLGLHNIFNIAKSESDAKILFNINEN